MSINFFPLSDMQIQSKPFISDSDIIEHPYLYLFDAMQPVLCDQNVFLPLCVSVCVYLWVGQHLNIALFPSVPLTGPFELYSSFSEKVFKNLHEFTPSCMNMCMCVCACVCLYTCARWFVCAAAFTCVETVETAPFSMTGLDTLLPLSLTLNLNTNM